MHKNTKLTTIYIVRHGETEWNIKGLLQGHGDSPLTQAGEQQAKDIALKLKRIHFDEVFSSDLLRAKRTAETIALDLKIAVKTTQALRERFYGKYEGKPHAVINQDLKKYLEQYKEVSGELLANLKLSPEVESQNEATSRFITFLREIAVGYVGKTILIVSHGGIMRYLLIHLGFGTYKTLPSGSIANTAYIKLTSDGVDFFVKETKGITKKL
ncbi:MAG: Phosphoglycerate mutase family protein [Candidatus Gottesmanbacteria bacterium GW2011_GWB1_43_11]|uniref:Phosphoglycerate mutase family protein n=1 Tax=Candidatus Gottesmanbacteria bacterium GW2011_GWB1_43_11 TaxID=1618446 RepID=A0A0G1CJI1_9BACT|nr:MAG: Phosphoglycerate mutase family protein [Candidatus Gottesmanbacteria bacterium GW2011_GWA1_42_26]KKS80843.1 MAG: Phosphoglycerate mutase family protein [Candidatus Gottesmanbacteria bacterium GW2011_GWC1_43_10]KKS85632.1 MAG: Phosphoglycerate mutase family protein [Candidatus Gottesmanbacteria bacterium GW2011_GWB1_43_11]OGG10652.1 MAG: hypothetical protein A2699_00295 [Candidatus Gottesmanbacteria bacterium RIFCSPHIGHO2_01_FULL_43_15]OGG27865.1 MAG: hypothetical protein A3A59_00650 [Ca